MNLAQIRRYVRDERVPAWRRFVLVGAVAYVLLPIDVIPDVVPLLGWLDDVGALGAALTFFAREVKRHADTPTTSAPGSGAGVQVIDAEPVTATRGGGAR